MAYSFRIRPSTRASVTVLDEKTVHKLRSERTVSDATLLVLWNVVNLSTLEDSMTPAHYLTCHDLRAQLGMVVPVWFADDVPSDQVRAQ